MMRYFLGWHIGVPDEAIDRQNGVFNYEVICLCGHSSKAIILLLTIVTDVDKQDRKYQKGLLCDRSSCTTR